MVRKDKNRESRQDIIVSPFLKYSAWWILKVFQVTKYITYSTIYKGGKGPRDKADNEERQC